MKPLALRLFAFVALVFPLALPAATLEQVNAWKATFPAATASDSPALQQMIASYQLMVNQVTPTPGKTLSLLKSKLAHDQMTANHVLHPARPDPKITDAMRAGAEEASQWLNTKFAPFLAKAPR